MSVNAWPEMSPENSLASIQRSMCSYLRNPAPNAKPEELDSRRLGVYRDLVFGNIESLLGSTYPVLKNLLGDCWLGLVREFIADHRAKTPYFTQLPKEFFQFLQGRKASAHEPLYLVELAHHELLELELIYREAENNAVANPVFSEARLALSNLADVSQYRYPVHELSVDFKTDTVPDTPTYLLVYRNSDNTIVFMQLSDLTFQLLSLISQYPGHTCVYWMRTIVDNMPQPLTTPQKEGLIKNGLALLRQLFDVRVLYATRVDPNNTSEPEEAVL